MRLKWFFLAATLVLAPIPAFSQSPYSAAVKVNGSAVTYFEIEQRAHFLLVLGTLGDLEAQARDDLIDDRLRQQVAVSMGIGLSEDEKIAGQAEFANRANLTTEQFIEGLARENIFPETFADFVSAGLLWRKVIQAKFQSKAFVTESELDTAMALGTTAVGASVLVSELILPLPEGAEEQSMTLARELSARIHSFQDFEEAALTYSASPSRANGGKLDWMPMSRLPGGIGNTLITLGVGGVTAPVRLPNAVALFQLRGIRDNRTVAARTLAYDYATLLLPGGRTPETLAKAAKIKGSIDTCSDLMAQADAYPEEYFSQTVTAVSKTPKSIARELANLDANEVSTNLTQGDDDGFLMFLMLCGRTNKLSEGNREQVRVALFAQRMQAFGDGYLQELKGDAIIVTP